MNKDHTRRQIRKASAAVPIPIKCCLDPCVCVWVSGSLMWRTTRKVCFLEQQRKAAFSFSFLFFPFFSTAHSYCVLFVIYGSLRTQGCGSSKSFVYYLEKAVQLFRKNSIWTNRKIWGLMNVHLEQINHVTTPLWLSSLNIFAAVISNNITCLKIFKCKFHNSKLHSSTTAACVYSQSTTSSVQSQTAPSDSIPAEVLSEGDGRG